MMPASSTGFLTIKTILVILLHSFLRRLLLVAMLLCASAAWGQVKPAAAQPAPQQDPRFEIRRFIVEGASLVSVQELEAATQPFSGPSKDFADVQRALEAIERLYTRKGYSAVQVILPEQELDRGEVHFKVVEARVGKVLVEGNKFFDEANVRASLPSLAPGVSPNVDRIAEALRVANENPAKQTVALLRGGAEEGTVDAVIRVTDEKPVKFSVTIDNSGTAETGLFRVGFGFQHANLWNRDHVFSGQYVMAPHQRDHPHSVALVPNPRVFIIGGSYRIPLYRLGDSLEFSGGYSNVNSGTVSGLFGAFNVAGAGTVFGARYNHNLPRVGELEHRLTFGWDWRAYNNRTTSVIGNFTVLPDVTVSPVSVTYSGVYRSSSSETTFNFAGFKNLPGGNDGHTKVFDAVRPGASPGYTVWRYGVGYNQAFASDWQGRFAFNGQMTRNRLISGEQFGIGGADSVRGFFEREVANDSGYRGTLEAYTPDLAAKVDWLSGFRLRGLAFYDWGQVRRFGATFGEILRQGIASVGFGMRMSHGTNLSVRLDYGLILDAGGSQGKWDGRPSFTLAYIF